MIKILGIESSCDETAASVVTSDREILSNIIHSQIDLHKEYGGVVPEIASRAHSVKIKDTIELAFQDANCTLKDIDAIAVTQGPGLIGGLIVGLITAKAISSASNIPLIGINHLEGHILTPRLSNNIQFPYLCLLLSGGHCQFMLVKGVGDYQIFGGTIDDALGEAFDKVAKMLGLSYPGGPAVEKLALQGDKKRFKLPKPLLAKSKFDVSFSGLKTAVLRTIESDEVNTDQDKFDLCASFQSTVCNILINRTKNILEGIDINVENIVIVGGVAANKYISKELSEALNNYKIIAPPLNLCTDNAAMIAWAGIEKFQRGKTSNLNISPKARMPLS